MCISFPRFAMRIFFCVYFFAQLKCNLCSRMYGMLVLTKQIWDFWRQFSGFEMNFRAKGLQVICLIFASQMKFSIPEPVLNYSP